MKRIALLFLRTLLVDIVISAVMALIIAFVMLQSGMKDETVKIYAVVIYAVSAFVGGVVAGKEMRVKKYIWGMISGLIYFGLIFIISAIISKKTGMDGNVVKCLVASVFGGGLGGMIS